jgi:hypothetical protein
VPNPGRNPTNPLHRKSNNSLAAAKSVSRKIEMSPGAQSRDDTLGQRT